LPRYRSGFLLAFPIAFVVIAVAVNILGLRDRTEEMADGGDVQEEAAEPEKRTRRTVCDTLRRRESLYTSLRRKGVGAADIARFVGAMRRSGSFNPRASYPGDWYLAEIDTADSLTRLEYHFAKKPEQFMVAERDSLGISVRTERSELERRVEAIRGEVQSSVWKSIRDLGEASELVMLFTDIFGWDIDFFTDPRRGDRFGIIFEKFYCGGEFVRYGEILAATYRGEKADLTAIFYRDPDGHSDHYTPDGKSLRKAFLRSPLNYGRITSFYSERRFHPILKIYRPHHGIDYAAPRGTPVQAIGDGVVVYAGWKGQIGKMVKIKHGNGYYTVYGHLSRIRRGIRPGKVVKQKEIIGYVGSTGLATGPHLHFGMYRGRRPVNPLHVKLPAADPVKKEYMAEFESVKEVALEVLDILMGDRASPINLAGSFPAR